MFVGNCSYAFLIEEWNTSKLKIGSSEIKIDSTCSSSCFQRDLFNCGLCTSYVIAPPSLFKVLEICWYYVVCRLQLFLVCISQKAWIMKSKCTRVECFQHLKRHDCNIIQTLFHVTCHLTIHVVATVWFIGPSSYSSLTLPFLMYTYVSVCFNTD
jgi:hypothetical protein